jgi:hypothetical protein
MRSLQYFGSAQSLITFFDGPIKEAHHQKEKKF